MTSRPAAGGGRIVDIAPERLERWLTGFAERHGAVAVETGPTLVTVTAADGSVSACEVPFGPLPPADSPYGGLIAHALADRLVGVLLVRLGGYAVGVFNGAALMSSKVGARQVHGRSAAGGWSQQRFARRREGQAATALGEAADVAARILLPFGDLQALVLGGDRRAVGTVADDPRLAALRQLVEPRVIDVPDPRLRVLQDSPRLWRAVSIRITEPPVAPS